MPAAYRVVRDWVVYDNQATIPAQEFQFDVAYTVNLEELNAALCSEQLAIADTLYHAVLTELHDVATGQVSYIETTIQGSAWLTQLSNYWLTVILGSELAT